MKPFKLGWLGDGGIGERLIDGILSGKKTATSCPAYDPEDSGFQIGDRLQLLDKHNRARGTLLVTSIELRPFSQFDDAVARAIGMPLPELKEATRMANGREIPPHEEMRVVHFEVVRDPAPPQP
ncbi:MAG: ASCH domain-containing protein [Elusimicrobia bacterium]|nr:ASCH domain-containing protein [Elusimicrobiota bacterium]